MVPYLRRYSRYVPRMRLRRGPARFQFVYDINQRRLSAIARLSTFNASNFPTRHSIVMAAVAADTAYQARSLVSRLSLLASQCVFPIALIKLRASAHLYIVLSLSGFPWTACLWILTLFAISADLLSLFSTARSSASPASSPPTTSVNTRSAEPRIPSAQTSV